jgi:DNA sulfur modification protein DndD
MKFTRLAIENLGPYLGSHEILLDVAPESPVVLIHGENMRGKTSLFNAIKWVLYGETSGRRGRQIPATSLLSYDAADARDYHMAVELDFEHEATEYRLERQVQAATRPATDRDFSQSVRLRRAGHLVPSEDVPRIIADILHPDISRFFLFDGEMLNQYEILLGEPGRDSELVRQSIEQILGLPALQLLVNDIGDTQRDIERRLLRSAEALRRNEAVVANARQISEELEANERDLESLSEVHEGLVAERDDLSDRLEEFAEIKADLREIDRIEATLVTQRAAREEARNACRAILQEAWWMPVASLARERAETLLSQAQEVGDRIAREAGLRAELASARRAASSAECEACTQPIPAVLQRQREARAEEIEAELAGRHDDATSLGDIFAARRDIEGFADLGPVERFAESERQYRRLGLEIRRNEQDAEAARERLKAHDRHEIAALELQFEQCVRQIVDVEVKIREASAKSGELRARLGRLQQQIAESPGADPRLVAESGLYASLLTLFTSSVDVFRQELRQRVQTEATDVFKSITTEPRYSGLRINDTYGLTIVDDQGRDIRERSAGAEQVVALSLIGGLNRSATRSAPVVMDTPFGRLDIRHRENVLRFVPTLAGQVILLVQSGELDRERDLRHFAGVVGREYLIARDGPTRSHIEAAS